MTFEDGGTYTGDVIVDAVMEGRGHLVTPVFDYTGAMRADLPHGYGKMRTIESGAGACARAVGPHADSVCAPACDVRFCARSSPQCQPRVHSHCHTTFLRLHCVHVAAAAAFAGCFERGKRGGLGVLWLADGTTMAGIFEESIFHEGVRTTSSSCATGRFAADQQLHGEGALTSDTGGHFVGAFDRGMMHCDRGAGLCAAHGHCGCLWHTRVRPGFHIRVNGERYYTDWRYGLMEGVWRAWRARQSVGTATTPRTGV